MSALISCCFHSHSPAFCVVFHRNKLLGPGTRLSWISVTNLLSDGSQNTDQESVLTEHFLSSFLSCSLQPSSLYYESSSASSCLRQEMHNWFEKECNNNNMPHFFICLNYLIHWYIHILIAFLNCKCVVLTLSCSVPLQFQHDRNG